MNVQNELNSNRAYMASLARGIVGGVISAGLAASTVGAIAGAEQAAWVAASSFFGYLAVRMGVEGTYDANRRRNGAG